jgi:tRNA-binding EMAP/Myf-like protein
VVVLANLKSRNMQGVASHGMLLAASDASHEKAEPLRCSLNSSTASRQPVTAVVAVPLSLTRRSLDSSTASRHG